jgi:pimeloyl-ACP methyl ester carboxylesterase
MTGTAAGPAPFRISVPDAVLADLHGRLRAARLPGEIAGAGWEQGTSLAYLRELLAYWQDGFSWRRQEERLNQLDHFTETVDSQRIHFVYQRSGRPGALPLLLAHGWPGSIVEFLDVIGPLTAPAGGGLPFDLIIPSLPGYGFSGPVTEPGWHPRRIAAAFTKLMRRLGLERYGVQGGDWGSIVAANMADLAPDKVVGLHLNFLAVPRPDGSRTASLGPDDQARVQAMRLWQDAETGYSAIQGTRPQTIGYALEDSPAGLAAWIVEKFRAWSDCGGDVERSFTKDQLLTNITLYWVTGTATSSARLYYEMRQAGRAAVPAGPILVPTGIAQYPGEITRPPRDWAQRRYNITHWAELPRGGHFAAMEVPGLFAADVRQFFTTVA